MHQAGEAEEDLKDARGPREDDDCEREGMRVPCREPGPVFVSLTAAYWLHDGRKVADLGNSLRAFFYYSFPTVRLSICNGQVLFSSVPARKACKNA